MQNVTIDLKQNPEVADVIKTMQPGDSVDLHCSIKSMDDQTLVLTVNEAEEGKDPEADPDADPDAEQPAAGESMDGPQGGATPDAAGMTGAETASM